MKKVAVILPSDKFQHRQILSGILEESRKYGAWQFSLRLGDRTEEIVGSAQTDKFNGIIAMVSNASRRKEILALKKPTVIINPPPSENCMLPPPPPHAAYVIRDHRNVGRTAAEYFLSLSFTRFACVETANPAQWTTLRLIGYTETVRKAGCSCETFTHGSSKDLLKWLKSLRPGTAIYSPDDERALQVLSLCTEAGISVPDTLAVLGTDNDTLLCESTTPPLASIEMGGEACGSLCARLLSRLMAKRKTEHVLSLAYPHVVTRQSSESNHISDPFLAKVFNIIRSDLSTPHTIESLAKTMGISRRTLELKSRQVLGKTLKSEINSLRLNAAVRILSNSTLSVDEVAARCGFCSASHLNTRLKAAFGYSTSVFRYQDPR